MQQKRASKGWNASGLRRARLLVWQLFYRTPLHLPIDEPAERKAAEHCRLTWPDYLALKATHPELWQHWAEKRAKAKQAGGLPGQPPQLRRHRQLIAPAKAKRRKERPLFVQWATREFLKQRTIRSERRRLQVLNRLEMRLAGC